ncbi:MAG: methyltransferase [Deltaproteobacteria bacterium]|nr:methyltransferase [Deltaproteobacteria bacterium]
MQEFPRHYFQALNENETSIVNHQGLHDRKPLKKKISTLRITGGLLKGRNITLLEKSGVRYTSSKVREAIFNVLGDLGGKKILDLFAGSGSFTIEAISRGALSATSVEIDRDMAKILKKNLADFNLNNYCHVFIMDVIYAVPFLSKNAFSYDIIFMDPPYERGYVGETMKILTTNRIYHADTLIVIEHSKRETPVFSSLAGWHLVISKGYGDTVITIVQAG